MAVTLVTLAEVWGSLSYDCEKSPEGSGKHELLNRQPLEKNHIHNRGDADTLVCHKGGAPLGSGAACHL